MNPQGNAGSNPQAGGSSVQQSPANPQAGGPATSTPPTNPQAGGSQGQTPAPSQGQPADEHRSANSQAEGRSPSESRDETVEAEWKRENRQLRERLRALEAEKTARADAELSETERLQKQVAQLAADKAAADSERRQWAIEKAVVAEAQRLRLRDIQTTVLLLQTEYGDQLDFDDVKGTPTNVPKLLDRLLAKKDWLVEPAPTQTAATPNSGRVGTSPRQTAPVAPKYDRDQPVPPSEWPSLSQIEWSRPREDLGEQGSGSGRSQ